ncbi:MAG TPA: alpha/beta fold hydrolase [Ramlibacter sp.]|nr:alpha/beta fold hydrolase [Ramlibacter sp.]
MPGSSRLARLLQLSCAFQVLLAFAWLAWRWPASPAQAVLGALMVPMIPPIAIGLELIAVRRVAQGDPAVPRPTIMQLLRAWPREIAQWFRVFWWRQPVGWAELDDHLQPGLAGTPVVFIHGFMCNRGFWTPWMQRLRDLGHPYVAVNLEPLFASIDDYGPIIDAAVASISAVAGRPPVLVCHSMGGVAARAWLRNAGSVARVAHLVTIGSPHHGTWLARFSRRANGRQMRLGSSWLAQLRQAEARHGLPPVTCWYSNCDNVVFPASTATLPGADNRFVPGQPHVGLGFHPEVVAGTMALLAPSSR